MVCLVMMLVSTADPDQSAPKEQSDFGLHFLLQEEYKYSGKYGRTGTCMDQQHIVHHNHQNYSCNKPKTGYCYMETSCIASPSFSVEATVNQTIVHV